MEEKEEKGGPDDDDDDEGEPTPATAEDGGDGDFDADAEEEEDDDAVSESEYDPSSQPATNANDSRNALRAEVVDLLDDTAEEMDDDAGDVRWGGIARKRAKKAAAAATNGERRNATATNATTPGSSGRGQTQKCPICSSMILEGLMNSHIDVCLTKGQAGRERGRLRRERQPKLRGREPSAVRFRERPRVRGRDSEAPEARVPHHEG